MIGPRSWVCLAATAALVALAPGPGQDQEWTGWTTEVPLADLTGEWVFDPDGSDGMLEEWADREILYRIEQGSELIRLEFAPDGDQANVQLYRWDGSLATFQRGGQEVRERARWQGGGRHLLIEGRRWARGEATVTRYEFEYSLEGPSRLVFVQRDEFGETTWRFNARR